MWRPLCPILLFFLVGLAAEAAAQERLDPKLVERHVYRSLLPQSADYLLRPDAVAFLDLSAEQLRAFAEVHVDLAFVLMGKRPRAAVALESPILLDGGQTIYCQQVAPTRVLLEALLGGMPDSALERLAPGELQRFLAPMEPREWRWAEFHLVRSAAGTPVGLDVSLFGLMTPGSLQTLAQTRLELAPNPTSSRSVFGQRRPAPVFQIVGSSGSP